MKSFQKTYSLIFAGCLIAFSAYALLDTFAISRVYAVVEQEQVTETAETVDELQPQLQTLSGKHTGKKKREGQKSGGEISEKKETPDGTSGATIETDAVPAADSGVQITISEYREFGSNIYVADIVVSSASDLKTAFSQNSYGRNVTAATSETAAAVGATLAVNGDNYGSREKGYVIRNGVLYRDTAAKDQEDLVIYADGSFAIINESDVTAQELLEQGAVQVFSFGPGLLENGIVIVDRNDEVDRAMASNPRTAIGILGENHYVLVVSDGRTSESEGLTLYELAEFMERLGMQTAYNLDGGGSSTMVYQGVVINETTSGRSNGERAVTDIIYF